MIPAWESWHTPVRRSSWLSRALLPEDPKWKHTNFNILLLPMERKSVKVQNCGGYSATDTLSDTHKTGGLSGAWVLEDTNTHAAHSPYGAVGAQKCPGSRLHSQGRRWRAGGRRPEAGDMGPTSNQPHNPPAPFHSPPSWVQSERGQGKGWS